MGILVFEATGISGYIIGFGPADTAEGLSWLERAAEGQHIGSNHDAAGVLAMFYEVGHSGLPRSQEKADYGRAREREISQQQRPDQDRGDCPAQNGD